MKAVLIQLKVALPNMKPQLTVVLLLQTLKTFSPAVGSEDSGNSVNLTCEHCPPS